MIGLEGWLEQATRRLAKESVAQVRIEIQEHYESAREDAIARGAADDEANKIALTALGDARAANCQYRRVLLTAKEAKLLREGNWEARMICSRPWLKRALLAAPVTALVAAVALFLGGSPILAKVAFVAG
jgi:hypothetical protein